MMHEIKRRARGMVASILGALIVCYFLVHSFYGERGILAWMKLQKQVAEAEASRTDANDARTILESRIALLRSENLDRDMLDERARLMVGFAHPDEYIIVDAPAPGRPVTVNR